MKCSNCSAAAGWGRCIAHARGVIHRDIKPSNVLIDRDGRVKVADFGLAKMMGGAAGATALTLSNMAMGTPDFAAPELLRPHGEPDHRADLYALGATLYQMLTGQPPRGMFKLPSQKTGCDPRFDAIVCKAMEAEREDRYQSADELHRDLEAIRALPVVAPGAPGRSSLRRVVAGALLLAAMATIAMAVFSRKERAPQQTAAARADGTIDLLALVDVQRDAIAGEWRREGAELHVQRGTHATTGNGNPRLQLPWEPPEEYDFEIEFTPEAGADPIYQVLSGFGRAFTWVMDAPISGGVKAGFETIDGQRMIDRKDGSILRERVLTNGQRHRAKVEVRRTGLSASLDGEALVRWGSKPESFQWLDIPATQALRDARHLGLAAQDRAVRFHKVIVRELPAHAGIGNRVEIGSGWTDWLGPRLAQTEFQRDGWIREADGITTDLDLKGVEVLPAGTRDGAIRVTQSLRDSGGVMISARETKADEGRHAYVAQFTGPNLYIAYSPPEVKATVRLVNEPVPAEVRAAAVHTLEFRFAGDELTAILNGVFRVSTRHSQLSHGRCTVVLTKGTLAKKIETQALDAAPSAGAAPPK